MKLYDLNKLVIKAFLITALSIEAVHFLEIPDVLSAVFCGLMCVSPGILHNFREGWLQMIGSCLGVIIGYLNVKYFGTGSISTGVAVSLVFYLCFKKKWESILAGAFFTVLYMNILILDNLEMTLMVRLKSVITGVTVATLINWLFSVMQHHRIYKRRFTQSLTQSSKSMVGLLESMKKMEPQKIMGHVSELKKLFNEIKILQQELDEYTGLGRFSTRLLGADKKRLLAMKLCISAWISMNRKLIELGLLYADDKTAEIFSQYRDTTFQVGMKKLFSSFSVNISKVHIEDAEFEPAEFNYQLYQEEVYKSSDSGQDEYVQSLYLHMYFTCIGVYRNLETVYRNRSFLFSE
jgi:hypothetical protein